MTNAMRSGMGARAGALLDLAAAVALVAIVVGALLALAVAVVPAAEQPATPAQSAAAPAQAASPAAPAQVPDPFEVSSDPRLRFTLELGNRMYPDWKETREVKLGERFIIGDTEFTAVVTKLLPDFIIDGKPISASAKLNNPAVRVMVTKNGAPADSAWAFLNFPPHYSPRSFFTFQLKEVVGYKPVAPANKDTAAKSSSKRDE